MGLAHMTGRFQMLFARPIETKLFHNPAYITHK